MGGFPNWNEKYFFGEISPQNLKELVLAKILSQSVKKNLNFCLPSL